MVLQAQLELPALMGLQGPRGLVRLELLEFKVQLALDQQGLLVWLESMELLVQLELLAFKAQRVQLEFLELMEQLELLAFKEILEQLAQQVRLD
jgi:hypothetical protein